jgi:hypothetical protein
MIESLYNELNTTGFNYAEEGSKSTEFIPADSSDDSTTDLTILYGILVVFTGAFCFGTMVRVPILE